MQANQLRSTIVCGQRMLLRGLYTAKNYTREGPWGAWEGGGAHICLLGLSITMQALQFLRTKAEFRNMQRHASHSHIGSHDLRRQRGIRDGNLGRGDVCSRQALQAMGCAARSVLVPELLPKLHQKNAVVGRTELGLRAAWQTSLCAFLSSLELWGCAPCAIAASSEGDCSPSSVSAATIGRRTLQPH